MHQDDDYAVIEMGASYLGDIQELVDIVTPDVSVVNNVAPAHIEGFGSIEGVAVTKGAIYSGLSEHGIAIVNADMPYADIWAPMIADRQVISFAMQNEADITAKYMQIEPLSSHFMVELDEVNHHFSLNLPGEHNVNNALAAIAICRALDIPVDAMVKGLKTMQPVAHRLQKRAGLSGATLIDDTYNANPSSYTQALKVLGQFPSHRWLVLGDFGELGEDEIAIHKAMGVEAKSAGVERLFSIGEMSVNATKTFGEGAVHYTDVESLLDQLKEELKENVTCLFKGSRFMQLDKIVEQLIEGEH
jgi:UDP-N-acetylmuramoyl-tripeptide--D-alanyl-D-alanine ligase